MMKKWLAFTMIITLLISSAGSASAPAVAAAPAEHAEPFEDTLDKQAALWTQGLAHQPGFERFAAARRVISPLGPGTHGWLVELFTQDDENENEETAVGYLVIHAIETGGFQLTEYGLGAFTLFQQATLHQALVRHGLIALHKKKPLVIERHYVHAFLSAWRVEVKPDHILYLDAMTGEELPATDKSWLEAADRSMPLQAGSLSQLEKPVHTLLTQPFDTYERMPWLTKKPLLKPTQSKLIHLLKHKKELRVTSEWFDGAWLYVLAVNGIQEWRTESDIQGEALPVVFIALGEDSLRFVPLELVTRFGAIYD